MNERELRLSALAFLASTFPPSISREVVSDQSFIESLGVDRKPQIELVGRHYTREEVFKFIRDGIANRAGILTDVDGQKTEATYRASHNFGADIIIAKTKCHFEIAEILAEDIARRSAALNGLLMTRSFPEHRRRFWLSKVERSLSTSDYLDFLADWEATPQNFFNELKEAIQLSGDLSLEGWLPKNVFPFDAMVGRIEDSVGLKDYFVGECLRQRSLLMGAGLARGIIQVGVGYVTSSPEFISTLSSYSDDDMATAITSLQLSSLNLNSLLLIFDICAERYKDERFQETGESIIEIIIEKPGTIYQDTAIAALALTPRVYAYQELKAQPEFYRRLVIWAFANLIGEVLSEFNFDREAVWKGMQHEVGVEAQVATALARRTAPIWRPDLISPEGVWGQSIRRMNDAIQRYCSSDVPEKWASRVRAGLKEIEGRGILAWGFAFGPLDEFKGSDVSLMECPPDVITRIYELSADAVEFIRRCKIIGMTAKLPSSLQNDIRMRLEEVLGMDWSKANHEELADALESAASIAGAYRDTRLAESMSAALLKLLDLSPRDYAVAALYLVIDTANAFEQDKEYEAFFIENVGKIAMRRTSEESADLCEKILNLVGKFSASLIPHIAPAKIRFRMGVRDAFL